MKKLKIVFAGTPSFAENYLTALINSKHDVVAVFTQPSKKSGRGLKLTHSPVRNTAEKNNIVIKQPEKISKKETDELTEIKPDILIVVAYGLILTREFISIPKYGSINVHPSLLPRWRGAAPIQRAIEAGDKTSGITIMQITKELDKGDIIYQESIAINDNDSSFSMQNKFIDIGIQCMLKTLEAIIENNFKLQPQNESIATYAQKIKKEEAKINWNDNAEKIHKKIMAFNIWPIAETLISGERIKIHDSEFKELKTKGTPGNIKSITNKYIEVYTKEGLLIIKKLQRDNAKALDVEAFIRTFDLKGKKFE